MPHAAICQCFLSDRARAAPLLQLRPLYEQIMNIKTISTKLTYLPFIRRVYLGLGGRHIELCPLKSTGAYRSPLDPQSYSLRTPNSYNI